jgi:catechol 2,3-dioxygenase-like lactoylglutathione lyase family enzyme
MGDFICGIQQMGVGTDDLHRDWKWYRAAFGMDIRIFEDAADAPLMINYTGGKVQNRVAALAMNMQGGGGFEIWQYKSRKPQPANFEIKMGDLGFLAAKMKSPNVKRAYDNLKGMGANLLTEVQTNPNGESHFYVADNNGYWFEVIESDHWFKQNAANTGGIYGSLIGVSDMDKSIAFYRDVLNYDVIESDTTSTYKDFEGLNGADTEMRRVILSQSKRAVGPFNPLLGASQIELVQRLDGQGVKIFKDRFWGDLGFIHMCYDVTNMDGLKKHAAACGSPFTVDSADSFDMGKAAGRFAYVEDPDGTLIEFVETHKLPIVEKWGWYMDLTKRSGQKSLPKWLLRCFKFNRIKD